MAHRHPEAGRGEEEGRPPLGGGENVGGDEAGDPLTQGSRHRPSFRWDGGARKDLGGGGPLHHPGNLQDARDAHRAEEGKDEGEGPCPEAPQAPPLRR
jgi:hypothetical protein